METKADVENEVVEKLLKNQGLNVICKNAHLTDGDDDGDDDDDDIKLQPSRKRCLSTSILITSSPKKKKKEGQNIIPPKKFLLGGSISDPLNLNSLQNEDINKAMNKTPKTSPLHSNSVNIKKDQVNVIIPRNLSDPLELSTCAEAKAKANLDLDLLKQKTVQKIKKPLPKSLSDPIIEIPKENVDLIKHDNIKEEESSQDEKDIMSSPPNKKPKTELSENCILENNDLSCAVNDVIEKLKEELENDVVAQTKTTVNISIPPVEECVTKIIKPLITLSTLPEKNEPDKHEKQEACEKTEPNVSEESPVVPPTTLSNIPCKPLLAVITPAKPKQKCEPKFKTKNTLFKYGNYNRYYGYRNPDDVDNRLKVLAERMDLFYGKEVLDIGCNIGHVTFSVARDFGAKSVVGMDIDRKLINIARKNVQYYITDTSESSHLAPNYQFNDYAPNDHADSNCDPSELFPISLPMLYGPINIPGMTISGRFPYNVSFVQGNYVLESDDLLSMETSKFDVILCLSITKWLHLNWGDVGLKRAFKRMYAQLRPGGILVVEPQPWKSYGRRKTLTEIIWRNYQAIQLKPPMFTEYLLNEVGFANCETLAMPHNPSKGFQRPLKLYRKSNMLATRNISKCTIVRPNETQHL